MGGRPLPLSGRFRLLCKLFSGGGGHSMVDFKKYRKGERIRKTLLYRGQMKESALFNFLKTFNSNLPSD